MSESILLKFLQNGLIDVAGDDVKFEKITAASGDFAQVLGNTPSKAVTRVIDLPRSTRIWIAAGVTDMRRGFRGLSTMVETVLEQAPYSGHVFVFRGKRGDLIKLLWFDGDGL